MSYALNIQSCVNVYNAAFAECKYLIYPFNIIIYFNFF